MVLDAGNEPTEQEGSLSDSARQGKEGSSSCTSLSSTRSAFLPKVILCHPNGLLHFSELVQENRSHSKYYKQS